MEDFFDGLSIEDMPSEDLKLVARACGVEVAAKLLKELPGVTLYVPKSGITQVKKNYIRKSFNGTNAKKLAIETGYSEVHLYAIVREGKTMPGERDIEIIQMDMFNNDNGGIEDEN
ncbi:MAG: Mor transcription activator family protein [Candidatus Eremiobacterota bacterium]